MMRLAALAAVTMLAFAGNSILNRMALAETETGPAAFALVRVASGAIVLTALVMFDNGRARLKRGVEWRKGAALTVYMLGFSYAYVALDAGLGALILFGVVQVTMFAGALLSGEEVPARRSAGALIGFTGLVVLLWPGGINTPPLIGTALMVVAAVGWGFYSLLGKKSSDPIATTAGSFLWALLPVGAVALIAMDDLTPAGAALAVLSGAVTSGLGYAMWYRILPQIPSSLAAVAQLTVPVIAVAAGAVLLGETVGLRFLFALLLVVGGVALSIPRRA